VCAGGTRIIRVPTTNHAISEMGHSRLNWVSLVMSGLPPVATVARISQIGAFVPKPDPSAFEGAPVFARLTAYGSRGAYP
jgi:hypothetical protein